MTQYFVVAIDDRVHAISALRERKLLLEAEITVVGEATADDLKRYDVNPGEILRVAAFSQKR